jgi:hypothetical protein
MKTSRSAENVLGVTVTGRSVHAVLIENGNEGAAVKRRFMRHRNARYAGAPQPALAAGLPDLQDEASGHDFSIQFGDGVGASNDLFLSSEFSHAEPLRDDRGAPAEQVAAGQTFEYELSEIVEQCREAGYRDPSVAFCLGSSDVTHVEIRLTDRQKPGSKQKVAPRDRKATPQQLLTLLKEQHASEVDPERVAFIPMTPAEDESPRFLALIARPGDAVTATLRVLRQQREERPPSVRLLDAEAPLYLGLARVLLRETAEASAPRRTLVVRAGAEDTLVMFLLGERLDHFESMRSLTTFDTPETICSRVLLQQDEYGIEEVNRVLLIAEEREQDLIESFELFFPDARVESLRQVLPKTTTPGGDHGMAGFNALAAAVRLSRDGRYDAVFDEVNLIPRELLRRKIMLPVSWPSLAMLVLLFATAFFFGARYILGESEIATVRAKLQEFPPGIESADPRMLQVRIDSLQHVYNGYMRALDVLDTLLVGSDQWSRGLEKISRESARVSGIWIDSWRPSASRIQLSGNATSRDRVVELAERMDGDIQALTFSEIREWPVYTFNMQIPVRLQLPEAARYLREQAASEAARM